MANATLRRRVRYWFDNTMSRGTSALVMWLGLASVAVVAAGGVLVWLLDPTPAGETRPRGFLASVWQAGLHLLGSGTGPRGTRPLVLLADAVPITHRRLFHLTA